MESAFVEEEIFKNLLGNDAFLASAYVDRDLAGFGTPNASDTSFLDPSQDLSFILDGFTSDKKNVVETNELVIDWDNAEAGLLGQRFGNQTLSNGIHSSGDESRSPLASPGTLSSPSYAEVKFEGDVVLPPWYNTPASTQALNTTPAFQDSISLLSDGNNQTSEDDDNNTGEEKSLKRKLQTRAASKLYRQRKKALEIQLTERLQKLEDEKKALIQQNQLAEKLLLNLQEENAKLRAKQESSAVSVPAAKQLLLNKLAVQIQEGAEEKVLEDTMKAIKECAVKCFQVGQCSLKRLISAQTVQRLVSIGFFEKKENWEILQKRANALCSFTKQILEDVSGLTKTQKEELEKICKSTGEELMVVYNEREELIKHIVETFAKLKVSREDSSLFLETVTCLEHLRQSLSSEAAMWNKGYYQILDVLNTLQRAQTLLKTKVQYASVCQLITFWNALSGEPTKTA